MTAMTEERFHERYRVDERGCWIWIGALASGKSDPYGWVTFRGRQMNAHRASWMLHNGEIGDLHVCHRCDVRRCVNPAHLFLGARSDNMQDMWNKGRHKSPAEGVVGSLSSKLTVDQARDIYRRAKAGERTSQLAREYGVSDAAVSRIKSGANWGRYV